VTYQSPVLPIWIGASGTVWVPMRRFNCPHFAPILLVASCTDPSFHFEMTIRPSASVVTSINDQPDTYAFASTSASLDDAIAGIKVRVTLESSAGRVETTISPTYCLGLAASLGTELGTVTSETVEFEILPSLMLSTTRIDCEGTDGSAHLVD